MVDIDSAVPCAAGETGQTGWNQQHGVKNAGCDSSRVGQKSTYTNIQTHRTWQPCGSPKGLHCAKPYMTEAGRGPFKQEEACAHEGLAAGMRPMPPAISPAVMQVHKQRSDFLLSSFLFTGAVCPSPTAAGQRDAPNQVHRKKRHPPHTHRVLPYGPSNTGSNAAAAPPVRYSPTARAARTTPYGTYL